MDLEVRRVGAAEDLRPVLALRPAGAVLVDLGQRARVLEGGARLGEAREVAQRRAASRSPARSRLRAPRSSASRGVIQTSCTVSVASCEPSLALGRERDEEARVEAPRAARRGDPVAEVGELAARGCRGPRLPSRSRNGCVAVAASATRRAARRSGGRLGVRRAGCRLPRSTRGPRRPSRRGRRRRRSSRALACASVRPTHAAHARRRLRRRASRRERRRRRRGTRRSASAAASALRAVAPSRSRISVAAGRGRPCCHQAVRPARSLSFCALIIARMLFPVGVGELVELGEVAARAGGEVAARRRSRWSRR